MVDLTPDLHNSEAEVDTGTGEICRLCDTSTELQFSTTIQNKYQVGYHRCRECHSLQTDRPFWLADTHAGYSPALDTGMVSRTILFACYTNMLGNILKLRETDRCLDWGGGNGLFCRLMRDRGFNFFNFDKFVDPFYCIGFSLDDLGAEPPRLITAFEVFEHLVDPQDDLASIFSRGADAILCSTSLYTGQDQTWPYLATSTGAHVFFYSVKALQHIGNRFDYEVIPGVTMHLFLKRDGAWASVSNLRKKMISHLLGKGFWHRWTPVLFDVWNARHADRFYLADRNTIASFKQDIS